MLLLVGAAALFAFSHTSRPPEPDGAPRLTSLDLYRRAYNDGHIWDSRNGDRKIIAREAVTRNTSDGRLDTLKLYDLYAIITAEDMAHEQWSDALRDNVAARAYLTRHDPASPNLFTCILTEADCLYHLHREEQAEKLVMEVIDAPAGKYRSSAAKHACFKLANFRLAHGKKEEAVQLLRKACEQDSDEEIMRAARLLLGNLLISLGRPQEAEPIIHDGLTWPGIPHKAGDFQEAMLRCYLAEGKYSEALTMRSNIDKSRIATPHPYNLCVQTITMYAGSRSYENTKFAVDTLIGMPAPVFDSAEWSKIDIKQCTKMLQAAGYGDLLKALEQRFPAWKAVT
jgi:tetratricopeptide (TPR) repeat protein